MGDQPKSSVGKYIVGIIILSIIIIGASYLGTKKDKPEDSIKSGNSADLEKTLGENETVTTTIESMGTSTPATIVIDYTSKGFTPNSVTIKVGDTVKFINKSGGTMWVASDEHPTHIIYAGTSLKQHCPDTAGTAFDQCSKGDEYSFIFAKAGNWEYHNHTNASDEAWVIVK